MRTVSLECMSPYPPECFKTDSAKLVKREHDGRALIAVKGLRIHPETKERSSGIAKFSAWLRPGGGPTDYVCGALAPGEPVRKAVA